MFLCLLQTRSSSRVRDGRFFGSNNNNIDRCGRMVATVWTLFIRTMIPQHHQARIRGKRRWIATSFRGVAVVWVAFSVSSVWYFEANFHAERSLSQHHMGKYARVSRHGNDRQFYDTRVTFRNIPTGHYTPFAYPKERLRPSNTKRRRDGPDYGGIESIKSAGTLRLIDENAEKRRFTQYREQLLDRMDADGASDEPNVLPEGCRDVAWRHEMHPTCNEMHSILLERPIESIFNLQDYNVTYLR